MNKKDKLELTPAQKRASKENFTIFMIRGWQRFVKMTMKRVLTGYAYTVLMDAMDYAVTDIKVTQSARMRKDKR